MINKKIHRFNYIFLASFYLLWFNIFSVHSQQMPKKMKEKTQAEQINSVEGQMMDNNGLIPQGIMIGEAKQWMVGYQVMFDKMEGNLVGSDHISEATILQQFMAAPTDMNMQMYMGMLMYAPSDKLTLMVIVPYIQKSMNHITDDGIRFNESTKAIGDFELRTLYSVYAGKNLQNRVLINLGMTLPTGSINQKMGSMRLEYPMQLGTGTVAISPGFTYLGQNKPWGWGVEFIPVLQIGKNRNGYRLGNLYKPKIWVARQLTSWLGISAQSNGEIWRNIHNADATLDVMDESTKDPNLQGGKRINMALGISIHPTEGFLKSSKFFFDFSKPVIQSLNGPQLQRSRVIKLTWQLEL